MPTGLRINCSDPSEANVVLLCAPYDRTASFRKGTAKGPAAIVSSLKYQMETYDRVAESMPSQSRKVALRELANLNRYLHRDHRKLVVVDGRFAFTGGLNVGDEYRGYLRKKIAGWRNTGVRMEGPIARATLEAFWKIWRPL